jgi:hypothetical protein
VKVQCEKCKEIVAFEFKLEPSGIRVHCPSCDASYPVPAPAPAPAPDPPPAPAPDPAPDPDQMTCPKCDRLQPRADACRACGLVIANWTPELAAALDADDPAAVELWRACEAAWDDAARHDAFLEHCRKADALPYAASRYRRAAARPGAAERLARVRSLAEHTLASLPRSAAPRANTRQQNLLIALVASLILVAGVMLLMRACGS